MESRDVTPKFIQWQEHRVHILAMSDEYPIRYALMTWTISVKLGDDHQ